MRTIACGFFMRMVQNMRTIMVQNMRTIGGTLRGLIRSSELLLKTPYAAVIHFLSLELLLKTRHTKGIHFLVIRIALKKHVTLM